MFTDYSKMSESVNEEIIDETPYSDTHENKDMMGKVQAKNGIYLRSKPVQEKGNEIATLVNDSEVLIVSDSNTDWFEVMSASGQEGFVMKKFIKLT